MRQIESKMRKALQMYDMILPGDNIAVAVSGGKDSVSMLLGLAGLRRYYGVDFSLTAITVDPRFENRDTDYSGIEELCRRLYIPYFIKRSDLAHVIFEERNEKNPCSLCARMRRGALHDLCVEHGCNKLALGHHMDDAVETFLLNLFHEGRLGTFAPVTYLSRKNITAVRPMILCTERDIINASARNNLQIVKSPCPMDGNSERQKIKEYISSMDKEYPGFLQRTFTAMQGSHINGL